MLMLLWVFGSKNVESSSNADGKWSATHHHWKHRFRCHSQLKYLNLRIRYNTDYDCRKWKCNKLSITALYWYFLGTKYHHEWPSHEVWLLLYIVLFARQPWLSASSHLCFADCYTCQKGKFFNLNLFVVTPHSIHYKFMSLVLTYSLITST